MIRRGRRAGFTFVEILIVIAIIAVLVGLLVSGITRILALQNRTQAVSEITQMNQSLETAKTAYNNADYLSSRLILWKDIAKYRDPAGAGLTGDKLELTKQTANSFRRLFGKRFITNGTTVQWGLGFVPPVNNLDDHTLSPSECLVFYLGGMASPNGNLIGFSKDPLNPCDLTSKERLGPYYQFRRERLYVPPASALPSGVPARLYPRYLDPWGNPYAFFAARSANNYDPANEAETFIVKKGTFTVSPYTDGTTFLNPNTFQIISAGADGRYGPGGTWNPKTGYPSSSSNGADDQANFSSVILGEPQS